MSRTPKKCKTQNFLYFAQKTLDFVPMNCNDDLRCVLRLFVLLGSEKMECIKRNKDGKRSLLALRKELENRGHKVYLQGSSWVLSENRGDYNFVSSAPYWANERDAIELLLGLDLSRDGF
jgi:hypothetical protein